MKDYLIVTATLLGIAGVVFLILFPVWAFTGEISTFEVRLYIAVFNLLALLAVFSILRLYNAIVANTKVLLANSRKMDRFISDLRRITVDSSSVAKAFATATKSLVSVGKTFSNFTKRGGY